MNADLIPVPFRGTTLFLLHQNDEPYTPMRPIVEGMGLAWQAQHRKLAERFSSTITEMVTVAEDGRHRMMTCCPLRKLPGWLMTISPNKVRPELRERIIAYQNECDDVLWRHWQERMGRKSPGFVRPETPFDQLDAALMGELRRVNKHLVQAYLIAQGLTPAYLAQTLSQVHPSLPAPRLEGLAAPVEHLRGRMAELAGHSDGECWYFTRQAFERLCAPYDAHETARWLRDLGGLRTDPSRLTVKAPRRIWADRPNVFAVRKALFDDQGGIAHA